MAARTSVLLTGFEHDEVRRMKGTLELRGLRVEVVPWGDDVLERVLDQPFDVVVIRFPVQGVSLARFLSAVRSASSPCRHTGVILNARNEVVARAQQFVGHGVNRVVPGDLCREVLGDVVCDLLAVAPRLPLRAPARFRLKSAERPAACFCQTVNISSTGVLLRGFAHYPIGTLLDFELSLPGDELPIRGAAQVSRHSNPVKEHLQGFGARFLEFAASDRDRLESFLARSLH
jgi:hypothetical protein